MRVSYTFDDRELMRVRYLTLIENTDPRYAMKPDPIYQPIQTLFAQYKSNGYPFILQDLLLATAVKMFAQSIGTKQLLRRGLFSTAGLYLALDIKHSDLAIRQHFGDFTASFSHQFGVGLSVLSMSRAFDIPYDQMNSLPVKGQPVLDYKAAIPSGGVLQFEAKGITSLDGISNARRSIGKKKETTRQNIQQKRQSSQSAMIGIIVQAALETQLPSNARRKRLNKGAIEIIDPEFEDGEPILLDADINAGIYQHYAGVAIFAGLYDIAKELFERARGLVTSKPRSFQLQNIPFAKRDVLQIEHRPLVGIQWRPGDGAGYEDVWFYQAVDSNVIRNLIVNGSIPDTEPYRGGYLLQKREGYAETLLPDGSYFGIGTAPLPALRILDSHDLSFKNLSYI